MPYRSNGFTTAWAPNSRIALAVSRSFAREMTGMSWRSSVTAITIDRLTASLSVSARTPTQCLLPSPASPSTAGSRASPTKPGMSLVSCAPASASMDSWSAATTTQLRPSPSKVSAAARPIWP